MASTCGAGSYSTLPFYASRSSSLSLEGRNFNSMRLLQRQRLLNHLNGISFRSKNGFMLPKSPSNLRVFCLRDQKATVVTGNSWDKSILQNEIPVLVEFYASWCGPCRMVHRVIDEIAAEYFGRLKCYMLNTDDDFDIADNYDIKAVPVVFLFKNGQKRESVIGTMPKEFYVAAIERVLSS